MLLAFCSGLRAEEVASVRIKDIHSEEHKGSPENVIGYIGRYSFRVAISNDRIKEISNNQITFEYKDYKDNSKIKTMTISADRLG